ncbi:MAG: PHP domain-containing protein, partial [Calditrichaeota bacterium]
MIAPCDSTLMHASFTKMFLISQAEVLAIVSLVLFWGIWGYAEIHLHLPFLKGRLYHQEPEIIWDLPLRCRLGEDVPLYLLIKDAHRFPVHLLKANVTITHLASGKKVSTQLDINRSATERFFFEIFPLSVELFDAPGDYNLSAELSYRIGDRETRCRQDNYCYLPKEPFRITIDREPLPTLENLYWGDLHIHSNYTDDQIEFGAPIPMIVNCARAMGLHFVAITDHSFDYPEAAEAAHDKWQQFLQECNSLNGKEGVLVLPGEEVSVGNAKDRNVHCLVLGSKQFFPGKGDGRLFRTKPTLNLSQLFASLKSTGNSAIVAAAHPFDHIPGTHRWFLRRDNWHSKDLEQPALDYWQILNGRVDEAFYEGKGRWVEKLLEGRKIGILGGTDAHGNFNNFRQIRIPLLQMIYHREQLLGQTRTGILVEEKLTLTSLQDALVKKRVIVSNGPAGMVSVYQGTEKFFPGDVVPSQTPFKLMVEARSSEYFGTLSHLKLCIGKMGNRGEQIKTIYLSENSFHYRQEMDFSNGLPEGYLRLEV